MFNLKSIVNDKANCLFIACIVIVFVTICGSIFFKYYFYVAEYPIFVCTLLYILFVAVVLESALIFWMVKRAGVCKRNYQHLHEEWESIYENSQVGIAFLKGGRYVAKSNTRLAQILGYDSTDAVYGADIKSIHLSEKNYIEFGEKYYSSLMHGARLHIEYQLKKKGGTPIWCMLSGKAIDKSTPADLDKGVVWIVEDISKRKKLEDDLRRLAETDVLTGLKNRRSFMTSAGVEFERFNRYNSPLSAIMLDIDHFKGINDSYGHAVGDEVLRAFAKICREQFRGMDVIGRMGGEEFAILLPVTSADQAVLVAERLRRACKAVRICAGDNVVTFTASFGVACAEEDSGVRKLLNQADQALYQAKRNGRDRVEVFTEPE